MNTDNAAFENETTRIEEMPDAKAGRLEAIAKKHGVIAQTKPCTKWVKRGLSMEKEAVSGRLEFTCPRWFNMIVVRVEALNTHFGFGEWHLRLIDETLVETPADTWAGAWSLGGYEYVTKLLDEVLPWNNGARRTQVSGYEHDR